jgi:hypothetical protein
MECSSGVSSLASSVAAVLVAGFMVMSVNDGTSKVRTLARGMEMGELERTQIGLELGSGELLESIVDCRLFHSLRGCQVGISENPQISTITHQDLSTPVNPGYRARIPWWSERHISGMFATAQFQGPDSAVGSAGDGHACSVRLVGCPVVDRALPLQELRAQGVNAHIAALFANPSQRTQSVAMGDGSYNLHYGPTISRLSDLDPNAATRYYRGVSVPTSLLYWTLRSLVWW